MKKILGLNIILLFIAFTVVGQNTVPPVKKGNSGTMTITPDPNKSGSNNSASSGTQASNSGNQNSVTVIIDHSGSMIGVPLNAAKNSSVILIDLIDLWGRELFSQQIGKINFQYIQFGGKDEFNVLYNLGTIQNTIQLRNDIINSTTQFGGTDFSSGIEPALNQLAGKKLNNKTIFLTDGGDNGIGASPNIGHYKDLVDTKYVIYGSPNTSVQQKGWLTAVPNGSEFHVNSEYEVLALFVKTLFEFVDDINYYLVRQGTQQIDKNNSFKIYKHSPNKKYMMILSKPANTNLEIEKILDISGKKLSTNSYSIYNKQTFFNIFLNDSLPSGEYKIIFKNSNQNHNLFYINFERCNIFLNLQTTPVLNQSECFVENSSVNFDFKYWDADQNKEINYADFLNHSAFHYKITDNIIEKTGKGRTGLVFSHSFPVGSAGAYQVWSTWSYNEEKMRLQNNPALSLMKEFCVSKNGSLVHLDYDTTMTWEGREIIFTATILDNKQYIIDNTKALYLDTGKGIVTLSQDSSNKQKFVGNLDYVKGNTQYVLSLLNKDNRFQFAFDNSSITTFFGKKRYVIISYSGKDYTSYKNKNLNNIFSKIGYVFSDKNIPVKRYFYEGKDIVIPYYLPYYEKMDDNIQFSFTVNKIFHDEEASLTFKSDSLHYIYPCDNTLVGGIWGAFCQKRNYDNAVEVILTFKDSTLLITKGNPIEQFCRITKKSGQMYFPNPLYKEPSFSINGKIQIRNKNRMIKLDYTSVKLDISTSDLDKFYVLTKWWVYKVLLIIGLCILFTIYLILFLVARFKSNQKVKFWYRLKNNELSQLEDLWSEPGKHKKCFLKLEIPDEIKNTFQNAEKKADKNIFINWYQSENSERFDEIKKRFCYRSLFHGNLFIKVLYICLFPLFLLIDLFRNAFEKDKTIIKNKDFLEYVQTVEDFNIANIPSEWSFENQHRIIVSQNQPGTDSVRLRNNAYVGACVEILFINNSLSIISKSPSVSVYMPDGNEKYLSKEQRAELPAKISTCRLLVNEEIEIKIDDIDYETMSCNLSNHLINNN
jgi:ABC-type glycerol-3-phosphate transport system permease component